MPLQPFSVACFEGVQLESYSAWRSYSHSADLRAVSRSLQAVEADIARLSLEAVVNADQSKSACKVAGRGE